MPLSEDSLRQFVQKCSPKKLFLKPTLTLNVKAKTSFKECGNFVRKIFENAPSIKQLKPGKVLFT